MGLFDFFKKKKPEPTPIPTCADLEASLPAKIAELTEHSKKELAVQRVTLQDMEQFTALPFAWNSEIQKVIGPSTQPYAFMDILGSNVHAACLILEEMNKHLLDANRFIHSAYRIIKIPVDDVVFTPSKKTGASFIMCNPYTFTGRISKYPASLHFTTPHVLEGDSTHGEIFFDRGGTVGKARVICWRQHRCFCFFYKTIGGHLVLDRIETAAPRYANGEHTTIYKNQ